MGKTSFKDLLEQTKAGGDVKAEDKVVSSTEKKEVAKTGSNTVTTKGGYDAFQVMSALQKEIRRGRETEAMYWAFELEANNPSWLWKRLMIMATEDVGIADPSVCTTIKTLWDTYDKMKDLAKGKTPESHVLGMAILTLCRSDKNHEALYFPMVVNWWRKYLNWRLDVPDYAIDVHTREGKKMGRGRNFWYSEGIRCHKKVTIDGDPYETAFRRGDEIKYNLENVEDYYYPTYNGHYTLTEADEAIDLETGLPKVGTYDKEKV